MKTLLLNMRRVLKIKIGAHWRNFSQIVTIQHLKETNVNMNCFPPIPANTRRSLLVCLMLAQRLRRWPYIKHTINELLEFPEMTS